MLAGIALTALLQRCAPQVAPTTMAAIVRVESGGNPFAIDDNTAGRSYAPQTRAQAELIARRLLMRGHLLDLGIAQIDSMNFDHLGLTASSAFDPCTNINAGARILAGDYAAATRRYANAQVALRRAIGMYNTGSLNRGAAYAVRVVAAAGQTQPAVPALREARQRSRRHVPVRPIDPAHAPILIRFVRSSGIVASWGGR